MRRDSWKDPRQVVCQTGVVLPGTQVQKGIVMPSSSNAMSMRKHRSRWQFGELMGHHWLPFFCLVEGICQTSRNRVALGSNAGAASLAPGVWESGAAPGGATGGLAGARRRLWPRPSESSVPMRPLAGSHGVGEAVDVLHLHAFPLFDRIVSACSNMRTQNRRQ